MATLTSPSEIARETLKALAANKLPPTPDNYAKAYQKMSGVVQDPAGAIAVLEQIAQHLTQLPHKANASKAIQQGISAQNWKQCQVELETLIFQDNNNPAKSGAAPAWSALIRDLLRQIEIPHKGVTLLR